MGKRKANRYSIVRYRANDLTGELVNVGVILHSFDNEQEALIKHLLIDESADKIRALSESQTELLLYKTYKENLQYYLEESTNNLFGEVGDVTIDSPSKKDYLESLYEFYKHDKLFLTRPKFSLTRDTTSFFEKIFESYVGSKYLLTKDNFITTKIYMKKLLEEQALLDKKVISDHVITPIKELDNVQIKIDFSYKNGVWNYMQGIPVISGPSQNTDWFAKTKFMFENLQKDAKVKLLYRSADTNNEDFMSMLNYFEGLNENIEKLDIEDKAKVANLLKQIADEAHDIDELMIS